MNVIVVCPRCFEEMIVHAHSLKWIRCRRCLRGFKIAGNVKDSTVKDRIQSSPRVPLKGRGSRK